MIFVPLSEPSIDVMLWWPADVWADKAKIDLSEWSFRNDVECCWKSAGDHKNPCRRVWDIEIHKDHIGRPTLADLGIVIRGSVTTRSVSTSQSFPCPSIWRWLESLFTERHPPVPRKQAARIPESGISKRICATCRPMLSLSRLATLSPSKLI